MNKLLALLSLTLIIFSATLTLTLGQVNSNLASSPNATAQQPSGKLHRKNRDKIRDQYIVVLADGVSDSLVPQLANLSGGRLKHRFKRALKGFSVTMTEQQALTLSRDPRVKYVEEDAVVRATQSDTPWGLDRINQRLLPLDNQADFENTGASVNVYVIDSGIRYSHQEFGGRAFPGFDVFGGEGSDESGHGTHVAGTIGGSTYGVAKLVNLYSVRVLNSAGTSTISNVIAGVDWVTEHFQQNPGQPAVANMSITVNLPSFALEAAVSRSIAAGVTYTVAAGNTGQNACTASPARVPEAITVGATRIIANEEGIEQDVRWGGSNHGTCVDLFAPGYNIRSAYKDDDYATAAMTGTSMAAPHVAGVAALYLQNHPGASPQAVAEAITEASTKDVIVGLAASSPNRLLFASFGTTPDPTPVRYNVALRTGGGYYLTAENGGQEINARYDQVGEWQTFALVDLNGGALQNNDVVTLQTANGLQVMADGGGGGSVYANEWWGGDWGQFVISDVNGAGIIGDTSQIALRTMSGNYTSAENGGGGEVHARATEISFSEIFTFELK